METTATWDPRASEFIIHSPTTLSQKYWITNSALHAKWSVVFAQLIIAGKQEGVHAFLVRIRHDNMQAVKGVRIEDMGHKMGYAPYPFRLLARQQLPMVVCLAHALFGSNKRCSSSQHPKQQVVLGVSHRWWRMLVVHLNP
jgi:hypothetical protein